LDIAGRHPFGVQGENLLVEARHAALVLADQLRLERAVAVAGRGDGQFAQFAADRLFRPTVAAIRFLLRGGLLSAPDSGESVNSSVATSSKAVPGRRPDGHPFRY
jgi:hypothetical protein